VYTGVLSRQLGGAPLLCSSQTPSALCESPSDPRSLCLCVQSSIALMDKSILPRPPLMAVARLSVDFSASEYAPPGQPLLLTSSVLKVQDSQEPYAVDIAVRLVGASSMSHAAEGIPITGGEEGPLYATGVATLHKIGAVRSLSG